MTILENETQQRIQEYEVRLQSSDDVSRYTISELRKWLIIVYVIYRLQY